MRIAQSLSAYGSEEPDIRGLEAKLASERAEIARLSGEIDSVKTDIAKLQVRNLFRRVLRPEGGDSPNSTLAAIAKSDFLGVPESSRTVSIPVDSASKVDESSPGFNALLLYHYPDIDSPDLNPSIRASYVEGVKNAYAKGVRVSNLG